MINRMRPVLTFIATTEEVRPPPVEAKVQAKPAGAAPGVNTAVINEAEKKFAEITKRLEKLEKEKQVKLVGYVKNFPLWLKLTWC